MSTQEIQNAIQAELDITPSYYDFKVRSSEKNQELWQVSVLY